MQLTDDEIKEIADWFSMLPNSVQVTQFARAIESALSAQADARPVAWATVLPSGAISSMRPTKAGADKRTAAWNERFPLPPNAVTRAGVTDDMRSAVRFAPSSAHWSQKLIEFFGPDAREGINALERQLREALAGQRAGVAECKWSPDSDFEGDTWDSACGEKWSFIDGGPVENRVRFCQGCGGRVVLAAAPTQQQEGGK